MKFMKPRKGCAKKGPRGTLFGLMIQETEEKQRLARMVGLLHSIQFIDQTAREQDVCPRFQSFIKTWGILE